MQKKAIFILSIAFSIILLSATKLNAQNKSYWELNYNLGTSLFFGDIKQNQWMPVSGNYGEWRIGTGFQFGRQISYVFGARGQFLYGQLAGSRKEWNRYFQSDYYETNLNFTLNFNNLFGARRSDRFFNVYMIGGIGISQYNTTVYEMGTNKILAKVGKGGANGDGSGMGGRTLEGILTTGLGVDFRINDNLHLNLESVHRGMNSDAYDAWMKGFPYDIYNYTSFGISWRFINNKKSTVNKITNEQQSYDAGEKKPVVIEEEVITKEPSVIVPDTIKQVVVRYVKYVEPEEKKQEKPAKAVVKPIELKTSATQNNQLEFRVQIRAKYGAPISIDYLKSKYKINDEIKEERHSGYYKYIVGSFATYQQARIKRDTLRSENKVYDAFVVAYYKGVRLEKIPTP